VKLTQTSKEDLLRFWQEVERKTGITISYRERVERVQMEGGVFSVRTTQNEYRAAAVLLAIGRRGTPRKLEVSGEELPKVVYRLIDPEQYAGQHVLVVGGGDSALEAAVSIAEQPDARVTLSYRGDAFSRAKQKNRERVEAARRKFERAAAISCSPDRARRGHPGAERKSRAYSQPGGHRQCGRHSPH
jgi:thioredoxin reductase